jgi:hypothetical protein
LGIIEKMQQIDNMQTHREILQKRYFLVINAETLSKATLAFDNINQEMMQAGLYLKPCDGDGVNACLKRLIPTINSNADISFKARYYVVGKKSEAPEYRRTMLITKIPKRIDEFYDQSIFNMDNVTINMAIRSLESEVSAMNKNPVDKYVNKLHYLSKENRPKNIIEEVQQEQELLSISELADDVGNGDEKVKIVKYMITLSGSSREELSRLERKVKTAVRKNKMRLNFCTTKQ